MSKRNGPFLPVLVAAGLLLSGVAVTPAAPALAAEENVGAFQLTRDAAVLKVREMFSLPEADWKVRSVALNREDRIRLKKMGAKPRWSMVFENTQRAESFVASIDANTGSLLSLNRPDTAEPKQHTLDQQFEIGEAFLKQYAPHVLTELARNTQSSRMMPGVETELHWDRKTQDGAYVINDNIMIEVSPGGAVTEFYLNWTDIKLPAIESKVTPEQAKDLFAKTLEMRLHYERQYNSEGSSSYAAVYKPGYRPSADAPDGYAEQEYMPLFDARTGAYLDWQGQTVSEPNLAPAAPLQANGPVQPAVRDTAMTEQDVLDFVEKYGLVRENFVPYTAEYAEKDGERFWQMRYVEEGSTSPNDEIYLSVYAITGELVQMYDFGSPSVSGLPAMSDADVKAKALELVKGLFPGRLGMLTLTDVPPIYRNGSTERLVQFPQLHNGLVTNGGIDFHFDKAGQLLDVNSRLLSPDELNAYPSTQDVIPADRAESILLEKTPLRLSWLIVYDEQGEAASTVPVYAPRRASYLDFVLDAKTGLPFFTERTEKPKPLKPTDIAGHWAEEVLTRYSDLGLLKVSADRKAYPDQAISRAELIRLAVDRTVPYPRTRAKATYPDVPVGHPEFFQIEEAYRKGWIRKSDAFRPTDAISREEAATIYMRMAGYKRLSQDPSIFNLPYADREAISEWAKGSVAIGYSFGVMRGADNQFRPKANITLAEAVTILERIPGMDDNIGIYPW